MLLKGAPRSLSRCPTSSRNMIVIIQGLVILFAGALEAPVRPGAGCLRGFQFAPVDSASHGDASGMEFVDALVRRVLNSWLRLGAAALAYLAGSLFERAGIFDDWSRRARCLPAPSPGCGRRCRSAAIRPGSASPWAVLVSVGLALSTRLCLDNPSRRPDRLRRRHKFPRCRLDHHHRPGLDFHQGSAPPAARGATSAPSRFLSPTRCATACR